MCLETHPHSWKERTHKHKQICGIVPGLCGCQNLVYVFFGSFLMGEKKHINKIPPKIPAQSREEFVYVLFSFCVFFAPCSQYPPDTIRWTLFRLSGLSPAPQNFAEPSHSKKFVEDKFCRTTKVLQNFGSQAQQWASISDPAVSSPNSVTFCSAGFSVSRAVQLHFWKWGCCTFILAKNGKSRQYIHPHSVTRLATGECRSYAVARRVAMGH